MYVTLLHNFFIYMYILVFNLRNLGLFFQAINQILL